MYVLIEYMYIKYQDSCIFRIYLNN
uniref:Uncharacterized protein n=1 Tax=Arundo donax TaxID=35708 RepID=A0A0A8YU94_ARUDO